MTSRDGWSRDTKGKYFQAMQMEDGRWAVGVIRNMGDTHDDTPWQAAACIKADLAEAVEWIDHCLSWGPHHPVWNVETTELFATLKEAQDVYYCTIDDLRTGELAESA